MSTSKVPNSVVVIHVGAGVGAGVGIGVGVGLGVGTGVGVGIGVGVGVEIDLAGAAPVGISWVCIVSLVSGLVWVSPIVSNSPLPFGIPSQLPP